MSADGEADLAGMTVNERLFSRGLFERWNAAVHAHDRESMLQIMREVDVLPAEPTVDAVLANPAFYGF